MINGIINVYKEQGYTSHDVVAKLRGITKQKKIGHTGTLDPLAEGVLPVCLGKATKLCDVLTDKDKTYEAVLLLGVTTDTQDTSGTVLKESKVEVSVDRITQAISTFIGRYDQIPPMYSAIKVNGKRLYQLAREGIEIERAARQVTIYQIDILDISEDLTEIRMLVSCSKGTYIRTLCQDIGDYLGCGGCMKQLKRTRSGRFLIEESLTLDQISALLHEDRLTDYTIPIDEIFGGLPAVTVAEEYSVYINNGNLFYLQHCMKREGLSEEYDGEVRVYDSTGHFVALYKKTKDEFRPVKMFI